MIGYDKRGTVFALTEGAELLLHDGESEGPLWRKTLDAPIAATGASGDQAVAATTAGTVTWFGARGGDVRGTAAIGALIVAAVADGLRVIAATADKIIAVEPGGAMKPLATQSATALAVAASGDVLAVAADGALTLITRDGTCTTNRFDGIVVRAVAHHPAGFWVLGLAGKVLRWDGTAAAPTHITSLPKDARLDHLACSERAIAIAWDDHMVVAMEWPAKETLGTLQYIEREVTGLAFGPWPWLGVALDLGDGNKWNLENPSRLHRSDTHPGRQHHSWLVSVGGASKPTAKPAAGPTVAASPPPRGLGLVLGLVVAAAILVYFAVIR